MKIKIGIIQMGCGENVETNQAKAVQLIKECAKKGAKIVCLQELFNALYFAQHVKVENYKYAIKIDDESILALQKLAKELNIVLIVPIFEEAMPGLYFNTALVFDADGAYLGKYRKTHIPDGPQYLEKYYFTPGDIGYPVFNTKYGKVAVGICWDEWFPEVARIFALQGADFIFYPSAIGSEPDRPGYSSAPAWQNVIVSHAITNGLFVAAPNRIGAEGDMNFYGNSFIADPFGNILSKADEAETIILAECDLEKIKEARELFHFFRDRRPDTYQKILLLSS